jgi:hypothetical protein
LIELTCSQITLKPLGRLPFEWSPERQARALVFAGMFAIALAFAAYTQHAWEDYYITYRVSKNLATGHGLVFTVGERVHVFTSPLNVLVPAALSLMTGNTSDELVLWLFRVLSSALLAGAAVLLFESARKNSLGVIPTALLVGMFGLDAKIVDFSINGQETAFMMFFLALALHALTVRSNWTILKLGLAGAGLMWTRPDGFIHFGAVTAGFLVFNAGRAIGQSRLGLLRIVLCAGAITTLLYLPWLLWAWHYYGSPVPHTIVAKGLVHTAVPLRAGRLVTNLVAFPLDMLLGTTAADNTLLPAYAKSFGGWHWAVMLYCRGLAFLCAFYWALPFGRPQGRAVSFAFMLGLFYLSYIAPYPSPWYMPTCAILAVFVFAQVVQQGLDLAPLLKDKKPEAFLPATAGVRVLAAGALLTAAGLLVCSAWQLRVQQREIEIGNRKQIGLWLRQNAASPRDTVFLEPLGYIGYFSQLKMLDTPGLSAPEVVAAERRLRSFNSATLIPALQPDWLVLRRAEAERIRQSAPLLLSEGYVEAKVFDASQRLASYRWLPGRGYLVFDAQFIVFKRNPPKA